VPAKNINLLIHVDFDKTILGKFLRWSLTYGRYIIICTEIVVLLAFIYRFSLDRKITDLNDEIDQKSAIIVANTGFETQFRNLQFRTQKITELVSTQNTALNVIRHLEQITPSGIILESFSLQNNSLSVQASADTNSTLALYLSQLKASAFISDVTITSLSKKIAGTGEISFRMEAAVLQIANKSNPIDL